MTSLNLIEALGPITNSYTILNNDDYAFIIGSCVLVKQFLGSYEKNTKILK